MPHISVIQWYASKSHKILTFILTAEKIFKMQEET